MASFLQQLSLKRGPLRRIVLLPDHLFFARVVPTSQDAAVARSEAEIAIEALSPFPLAQLYYGYFHVPGSARAVVYAAYRRRFTTERAEEWREADLVLPNFAAVFGDSQASAGTWLVHGEGSIVAVRWDGQPVPADVLIRPVPSEDQRPSVRDSLLLELPVGERIREATEPLIADESSSGPAFTFRANESEFVLSAEQAAEIDVRDKAELQKLRRAQARDRALWRTFLVCVAAIGIALAGELTLAAARVWQGARQTKVFAQRPVVASIMTAQSLTRRIDELSTKRLRPFEMLAMISAPDVRPRSIQFLRTTTSGLYGLEVDAQTEAATEVGTYRNALSALPGIAKVELSGLETRGRMATFHLVITYKPEALSSSGGVQ